MHAQLPSAVTPGQRERQSLRAKQVLGWGLVLFAALQALWLVRRFGVNVVIWDEWAWVRRLWSPDLWSSDLWAQHNEHRIPVGGLVILALYRATGVDTRAGMYGSWVCIAIMAIVVFVRFRRVHPAAGAIAFAPVAILLFTLRQYENLLWGFQLTVTLSALFVVVALAPMPIT